MPPQMPIKTQAQRLREKLAQAAKEPVKRAPGELRVILPSPLSRRIEAIAEASGQGTTPESLEKELLAHCQDRLRTLSDQQGRADYGRGDYFTRNSVEGLRTNAISFMGRQHLAHLVYQGQFDWRRFVLGGIWTETNLHFPITRRIIQQQIARAANYFTGTSPWFSCYDVNAVPDSGAAEAVAAMPPAPGQPAPPPPPMPIGDKLDRWARFEAEQSELDSVVNEAIGLAFIQGQQVVKTVHQSRVEYYDTRAKIMIDPATNKPLLASDGDYIFDTDKWVPNPTPALVSAIPMPGGVPDASALPATPPNAMVLARDLKTPMPPNPTWDERDIKRKIRHFHGAKSTLIHYCDFLCEQTAPTIQESGFCAHITNEPVVDLFHRLLDNSEWAKSKISPEQQLARLSELMQQIGPGLTDGDKAGAKQARPELREGQNTTGEDANEPQANVVEFYLYYDFGDGNPPANILVIADAECRTPIFYDYVANVTWNGQRPFDVYRVNPVAGRWHGQSQVEVFWQIQYAIDLFLNRMHLAATSAGRIDVFNPFLTVEGQTNPNLELNWGRAYRAVNQNVKASDVVQSVYLQAVNFGEFRSMIEMLIQIATNMSGVSNANDAQAANLDSSKLATGINNIENSGQELFRSYIQALQPGVSGHVKGFIHVTSRNLDLPRLFRFFDGEIGALAEITPDEVRDLELDVTLELTRFHQAHAVESDDKAWGIAVEFYTMLPEVQSRLAPLARNRLRSLQIPNADEFIQPLMLLPPGAPGQPPALPAPPAP